MGTAQEAEASFPSVLKLDAHPWWGAFQEANQH
jgi:hypothetical protein